MIQQREKLKKRIIVYTFYIIPTYDCIDISNNNFNSTRSKYYPPLWKKIQ